MSNKIKDPQGVIHYLKHSYYKGIETLCDEALTERQWSRAEGKVTCPACIEKAALLWEIMDGYTGS